MYTLIIVDDEKNVLQNISEGVNWEDFGFILKGCFTSVKDALEYLEQSNVDCIISDIKMPEIDGLQFAEIVNSKYPDICFIILSAHKNFTYAQQALRHNVMDYVLKPITYKKIENALKNVVAKLQKNTPLFPRSFSSKHKLVSSLIDGKISDIDLIISEFKKEGINIDADTTSFALVKIQIENFDDFIANSWPYDVTQFQNAFSYIAESDMPYVIETSFGYGYTTVLLVDNEKSDTDFLKFINKTISTIGNNYFDLLNCHVEFEIISIFANLKDIINSNVSKTYLEIHIEELINKIVSGNISGVLNYLDENFTTKENNTPYIKAFSKCLITEINNLTDIHNIQDDFTLNNIINKNNKEIIELTRNIADKATVYFLTKSTNSTNLIKVVKDYINEHYAENIMLSDLANLVYISDSHLSRTFKQKTGESIVSFINKTRLNHARELLISSNLSIEEVYSRVGYKSRNLFFKNFKAVYGVTPNKYRTENINEI